MFGKFSVSAAGLALVLAVGSAPGSQAWAQQAVTIYSAPNWYQTEFDAFTKATRIKVQYIEAGSRSWWTSWSGRNPTHRRMF